MKINYKEDSGNFLPAPEYSGIAKIVDTTSLTEYTGQYGTREQFRFILEIDEQMPKGDKPWTVATKPLTPSLHEKSSLRAFVKAVIGRDLTEAELKAGFDTEALINRYCSIVVEHVKSAEGDKTFSNIVYVGKAKSTKTWDSGYVRIALREEVQPTKTKTKVVESAPAEEAPVQREVTPTETAQANEFDKFFK